MLLGRYEGKERKTETETTELVQINLFFFPSNLYKFLFKLPFSSYSIKGIVFYVLNTTNLLEFFIHFFKIFPRR